MDTNVYWQVRGTYEERKKILAEKPKEWLENAILDKQYNEFISSFADAKDEDSNLNGCGKRIPYIGWYWRHINFSELTDIPIGDCGEFIGFMANNKWDYNERNLTKEEAVKVISYIDEAMRLNQQGGMLNEILENTHKKLAELWDYMQTLKI